MTKTNKKNLILWASVAVGFATIFGTSAALYFSAGNLQKITDKNEYLIRQNEKLTLDGYYFDMSATYGSVQSKKIQSLMTSNLIRVETTGETKFVKDALGNLVVSESSKSRLVLEMAKEVVLTFQNSAGVPSQVVFNTDLAERTEFNFVEKPETINLKSNNKKSINSEYFDELLLGRAEMMPAQNGEEPYLKPDAMGEYSLKSLGFTVKDDIYWVDSNGNKTDYEISPRDFYYSYMRTWLYDRVYRRDNGGSKLLDEYFINLTGALTRFGEEKEYPNDYLLGLFGINSEILKKENETIKDVTINGKPNKMFTISALENSTPNFTSLLYKAVLDSYLFSAAPSQFIDELVQKNSGVEYPVSSTKKEKITGITEKFGIYIYGQTREDNLFASSYIPVSGRENRIIFKKNKFFSNKEFLNQENTLERIIFEFSTSPTFNEQLFNNYFEGTVSEMPYVSLTQQQKIKIFGTEGNDEFAFEKGLLQVKQLNKTSLVQRTLLSTDPRKFQDGETGEYLFNEEYANVIYGSTIEELKAGTAKTANSFFNGPGFELRTLFNASINWYTFINNSTKGLKQLWLNHTAPNAEYNSKSTVTPIDFQEEINNIGYFNGNKKVTITESDMKKRFLENSASVEEQYKTHEFNNIKTLVEKLLDKEGITKPLKWKIVYPHADGASNHIKIAQLDMLVKTLESLDSKGRIKPEVYVPNNQDEVLNAISVNKGISDFNGWGYDYEGIGSFIDGISHATGISLMGAFSLYSDIKNKDLRIQSPEFAKLSSRLKEVMDNGFPLGLKVDNWIDFTNDNNNKLDALFKSKDYAIGTELAKFFLMYQEEITDREITDLIIELNIIAGFAMESDISIDDSKSTSLSLVLMEYYYPTTNSGILYLSDIRTGDKSV